MPRAGQRPLPRNPARSRGQHDGKPRVMVNQISARFRDDPFRPNEQRHIASVTDAKLDENLGQLFEIAIGQIRYRPRESGETFETSDVTLPDVGDERIFVGPDVEGLGDKAGASSDICPRPAAGSSTRPLIGTAPSNAGTIHSESSAK